MLHRRYEELQDQPDRHQRQGRIKKKGKRSRDNGRCETETVKPGFPNHARIVQPLAKSAFCAPKTEPSRGFRTRDDEDGSMGSRRV
jgi:hypothetical protein